MSGRERWIAFAPDGATRSDLSRVACWARDAGLKWLEFRGARRRVGTSASASTKRATRRARAGATSSAKPDAPAGDPGPPTPSNAKNSREEEAGVRAFSLSEEPAQPDLTDADKAFLDWVAAAAVRLYLLEDEDHR